MKVYSGQWPTKDRFDEDGKPLCRKKDCPNPPNGHHSRHGLCEYHFDHHRLRVRCDVPGCKQPARMPWADKKCPIHHWDKRELTPYESTVLEKVRSGKEIPAAVSEASGLVEPAAIKKEILKLGRSAAFSTAWRETLAEAGVTENFLAANLMESLTATKTVAVGEDKIEEADHRARNTARDQALKLLAAYPKKDAEEKSKAPVFNVVMLPPERPPAPDMPVYKIPPREKGR